METTLASAVAIIATVIFFLPNLEIKFEIWLTEWRRKRKKLEHKKAKDNGFGWAMAQHFLHEKSITKISSYMGAGSGCHPFDDGIDEALMIIDKFEDGILTVEVDSQFYDICHTVKLKRV